MKNSNKENVHYKSPEIEIEQWKDIANVEEMFTARIEQENYDNDNNSKLLRISTFLWICSFSYQYNYRRYYTSYN